MKAWDFDTTNLLTIRKTLNDKENEIYVLNADNIDIEKYLEHCMIATRRNILKEPDEWLPRARRTMKM